MAGEIIEEHLSPDGLLHLTVTRDESGDTSIGFDVGPSRTHGSILGELYGLPEEEAIRQYINQILSDGAIIVVSRCQQNSRHLGHGRFTEPFRVQTA